jgi:hypothetical protein
VFAGYSEKGLGYANITFELDFKGEDPIDITCGETKIGDTLADGTENEWNIYKSRHTYVTSRESNLKFTVTQNDSVFTFNGNIYHFPLLEIQFDLERTSIHLSISCIQPIRGTTPSHFLL